MNERTAGFVADVVQVLVLLAIALVYRHDADVSAQVKGAVMGMVAGRFVVRRIVRATARRPPSSPSSPPSSPPGPSSPSSPSSPPTSMRIAFPDVLAVACVMAAASCAVANYTSALDTCVQRAKSPEEYSACKRGVNARFGRDAGPPPALEDGGADQ